MSQLSCEDKVCYQCGSFIFADQLNWPLDGYNLHAKVNRGADSCYWRYKRAKREAHFKQKGRFRWFATAVR